MYLRTINRAGALTSYNLDVMSPYRLAITTLGTELGVGIYYFVGAKDMLAMVAAIDLGVPEKEFRGVAKKGLPFEEREKSKECFQESLKILYNAEGIDRRSVDDYIARSQRLADIYYGIYDALKVGADTNGEFEGYRYFLTQGPTW